MEQADHATAQDELSFAAARHERDQPGPLRRIRTWMAFSTVGNPVLVKEFRTRMRGARAYWILLAYALLLAGVVAIMYFNHEASVAQTSGTYFASGADRARDLGRAIYYFIFIAQAIMVALITPALTSGAVTIEREQRSYELLVTTPLRPADIIRGKLAAAVAFVVLLLTISLPLASLSFLVGGVSPGEVVCSYLILALAAFVYGAVGIFWSAAVRSTALATVVTYLTVVTFFVVSWFPGLAVGNGWGSGATPEVPFQSVNPISAAFRAVQPEYLFVLQVPSWISAALLNLLLAFVVSTAAMGRLEHFHPPRPAWLRSLCTALWCTVLVAFFGPLMGAAARSWTSAGTLREWIGISIGIVMALAVLVAPVFSTGDVVLRRGESALRRYLRGLLPDRMWRDDLSSGVPLVLTWTAFGIALIPLGVFLQGKLSLLPPRAVLIPGSLLCLAAVLGVMGTGNLLSVFLPSRWAACILTYLAAVVVLLLPYFTLLPWYQAGSHPQQPQLLWQLLYLAPFDALAELIHPVGFWSDHPPMALGHAVPLWMVTVPIYLASGLLCLALSAARIAWVSRRPGQPDEPRAEIGAACSASSPTFRRRAAESTAGEWEKDD